LAMQMGGRNCVWRAKGEIFLFKFMKLYGVKQEEKGRGCYKRQNYLKGPPPLSWLGSRGASLKAKRGLGL